MRHSTRLQEISHQTDGSLNDRPATRRNHASLVSTEKSSSKVDLPRHSFGGPLGTFILIFALPFMMLYLNKLCTRANSNLRLVKLPREWSHYWNMQCIVLATAWCIFQALLYIIPMGAQVRGLPLRNGKRLLYNCNGFYSLIISILLFVMVKYYFKLSVGFVLTHWTALMTAATLLSVILATALYIKARYAQTKDLSEEGNSGYRLDEFFMGRELNPRLGSLDFKLYSFRLGLITWLLFNLIFCFEAIEKNSKVNALFLVSFLQLVYVGDALWHEHRYLSTMDITQEGFGFMLAFGEFAFVPFVYTLTTRYLYVNSLVCSSITYSAISATVLFYAFF